MSARRRNCTAGDAASTKQLPRLAACGTRRTRSGREVHPVSRARFRMPAALTSAVCRQQRAQHIGPAPQRTSGVVPSCVHGTRISASAVRVAGWGVRGMLHRARWHRTHPAAPAVRQRELTCRGRQPCGARDSDPAKRVAATGIRRVPVGWSARRCKAEASVRPRRPPRVLHARARLAARARQPRVRRLVGWIRCSLAAVVRRSGTCFDAGVVVLQRPHRERLRAAARGSRSPPPTRRSAS